MWNKQPVVWEADHLRRWNTDVEISGKYYAARPIMYRGLGLLRRIRIAWSVFIGECDAVIWAEQYLKGAPRDGE